MQQGGYTALATEPFFLWAFRSFRAAFLATRLVLKIARRSGVAMFPEERRVVGI